MQSTALSNLEHKICCDTQHILSIKANCAKIPNINSGNTSQRTTFLFAPIRATYSANLFLLDLIRRITSDEESDIKSLAMSLFRPCCYFLYHRSKYPPRQLMKSNVKCLKCCKEFTRSWRTNVVPEHKVVGLIIAGSSSSLQFMSKKLRVCLYIDLSLNVIQGVHVLAPV